MGHFSGDRAPYLLGRFLPYRRLDSKTLNNALVVFPIIFKVTCRPDFNDAYHHLLASPPHAKALRGRGRCYARQLRRRATPKACQKDCDEGQAVFQQSMSRYLWRTFWGKEGWLDGIMCSLYHPQMPHNPTSSEEEEEETKGQRTRFGRMV